MKKILLLFVFMFPLLVFGQIRWEQIRPISAQVEKTVTVDDDLILIQDSEDSGSRKYVRMSNLPSGGLAGSGTANTLTKFISVSTVGNSGITENGTTVDFGALDLTTNGDVTHAAPTLSTQSALLSDVQTAVSGTDGFVSNFDGTDALEDSPIFTDGTNVGIGTASPDYLFEINGTLATSIGNLILNGQEIYSNYEYSGDDGSIRLNRIGYLGGQTKYRDLNIYNGKGTSIMFIDGSSGNAGVGVTDPDTKVEILNAGNQLKLSFDGTDNAAFGVDTNGDLTITNSGTKTIFTDDIELNEDLIDINGSTGTAAQVLSSLGAGLGVDWVDASAGVTDHSALSNLDFASAGHTDFVSTTTSQSIGGAKTFTLSPTFNNGIWVKSSIHNSEVSVPATPGAGIGVWYVGTDGKFYGKNDVGTVYDLTGAGSGTDLSITGTVSPLTLNSSDGTDVTFTAGTNITLAGTSSNITINSTAGGGNVSNTGTPVNNQVSVWTDATTIEGSASFIFDGSNTSISGYGVSDESRVQGLATTGTYDMNVLSGMNGNISAMTGNIVLTITNLPDGFGGSIEVINGSTSRTLDINGSTGYTTEKIVGNNNTINTTVSTHTTVNYWRNGSILYYQFIYSDAAIIQRVDNGAKTASFAHDANSANIGAYRVNLASTTVSIHNLSSGMQGTIFLDFHTTTPTTLTVNTYSDAGITGLVEVIMGSTPALAADKATSITYTCANDGTNTQVYLVYGQE